MPVGAKSDDDEPVRAMGVVVARTVASYMYDIVGKELEQSKKCSPYFGTVHEANCFLDFEADECTCWSFTPSLVAHMRNYNCSDRSPAFHTMLEELHCRMYLTDRLQRVKHTYHWNHQTPDKKFTSDVVDDWVHIHGSQVSATNLYKTHLTMTQRTTTSSNSSLCGCVQ